MPLNTLLNRRRFLGGCAGLGLAVSAGLHNVALANAMADPFPLPALPYSKTELEPVISVETVSFHYGKHTAGYFKRTNAMAIKYGLTNKSLPEVVRVAQRTNQKLFNDAAQSWNHQFYWEQMAPGRSSKFSGRAAEAVKAAFGDYDTFKKAILESAKTQFASGWVWLVEEKGQLSVMNTPNAMTPIALDGIRPLMVIDVWEHAYYLDYQNRRTEHVGKVLDKLIDWNIVAGRMA